MEWNESLSENHTRPSESHQLLIVGCWSHKPMSQPEVLLDESAKKIRPTKQPKPNKLCSAGTYQFDGLASNQIQILDILSCITQMIVIKSIADFGHQQNNPFDIIHW